MLPTGTDVPVMGSVSAMPGLVPRATVPSPRGLRTRPSGCLRPRYSRFCRWMTHLLRPRERTTPDCFDLFETIAETVEGTLGPSHAVTRARERCSRGEMPRARVKAVLSANGVL